MENKFENRDFEQLVKQNADQYRMFPSERVWKSIHNTLHTRKRWYGIGLAFLILTTGVVTWVMLNTSGKNSQVVSTLPVISPQPSVTEKRQKTEAVIIPNTAITKTSFITSTNKLPNSLFFNDNTREPEVDNTVESLAINYNDPEPVTKTETISPPELIVKNTSPVKQIVYTRPLSTTVSSVRVNDFSFSRRNADNKETTQITSKEKISDKNIYPLSIESVVNYYTHVRKREKIAWQIYFTPTISYRDLKENKAFINSARNASNGTNNIYYSTNINNIVTHKPDVGFQFGFTAGYPLFKNLKLIGGLQFNVSKYDIKAYTYPSEVATIALSTASGGTNTVSALTNYRNTGGYKANWLHNLYFSASVPIGLELKLSGKRKSYVGVSGTIQPTYLLSNRAYLLSTDYKNYAEIPSLTRKWNINTGFEMFAGYSTGKLQWRVGPQVRYQTMSSFQKKYPVQEHLFDFGLKLGIMLNK